MISHYQESTDMVLYGLLGMLIVLLIISILAICLRGWLAIVIPIRSIDPTNKMDIWSDFDLMRTHIGRYFAYVLWYSVTIIALIIVYILILILASALSSTLGWVWGIWGIIGILYAMTRLYLTWYHMLSEGSSKLDTFREAIRITKGKALRIFLMVLGFAIIIWFASSAIDSALWELLWLLGSGEVTGEIARTIGEMRGDLPNMLNSLTDIFTLHSGIIAIMAIVFSVFYSLSTVITRAMYHIFYVRYYLDIRAEYESERSWVGSILKQSLQK